MADKFLFLFDHLIESLITLSPFMNPIIQVIDYSPSLQKHFENINKVWIEELFSLEDFDIRQLTQPEKYIIEPGGAVLFASLNGEIVGTVGLSKVGETTFELIKMCVAAHARGNKIGHVLVKAVLEKAKALGAKDVVLYTNTQLIPAISIYRKAGFEDVQLECGKYDRCDLKMRIDI
jgi:GNAT superfamily N-acetyltransferase